MIDPLVARVAELRASYRRAATALPWLDAARWEDEPPTFAPFAWDEGLPAVARVTLTPELRGKLGAVADREPTLVRYDPEVAGPLASLDDLLEELAEARLPLVVLHTDLAPERIGELAARHPRLRIVIESGPLKILYFIEALEAALRAHENLFLCTANLCNWLGLERLCAAGLGDRLLFGTHAPRFSAHAAMGPVVMARLSWPEKCAIAGDNLRRLLGLPIPASAEVGLAAGPPFIIDAHGHTGPPGRFPTPDEGFGPEGWLAFMDECALGRLLVCPIEAINDPNVDPRAQVAELLAAAPGRFGYFEVFRPGGGAGMLARIERNLADPACAGTKLHPSMHGVPADDDAYAPAFALAERTGAALLTHSWEASSTNPTQHLSLPARFERHLRAHPGVRLVLGHAGGRPSTMDSVAELGARYPGVHVDLAGDYYDTGLVETLCARLGAERVLFASDVNWIDPRANLAPVLAARISDADALRVLRSNALAVYRRSS